MVATYPEQGGVHQDLEGATYDPRNNIEDTTEIGVSIIYQKKIQFVTCNLLVDMESLNRYLSGSYREPLVDTGVTGVPGNFIKLEKAKKCKYGNSLWMLKNM